MIPRQIERYTGYYRTDDCEQRGGNPRSESLPDDYDGDDDQRKREGRKLNILQPSEHRCQLFERTPSLFLNAQ